MTKTTIAAFVCGLLLVAGVFAIAVLEGARTGAANFDAAEFTASETARPVHTR